MVRRGVVIVLSSPSGGGKSSLAAALRRRDPNVVPSVSVTTRAPRPGEVPGVHYEFLDGREFARVRDSGGLLEWAEVHGNLYGSPREPVERSLAAGRDVLFVIDWQGARALARSLSADMVSVFLLPPSAAELRARLERRAEDPGDVIERRMANARGELARWAEYDHVLVNDDFGSTLAALAGIVEAARERRPLPRAVPAGIEALARDLDAELAEPPGDDGTLAMTA